MGRTEECIDEMRQEYIKLQYSRTIYPSQTSENKRNQSMLHSKRNFQSFWRSKKRNPLNKPFEETHRRLKTNPSPTKIWKCKMSLTMYHNSSNSVMQRKTHPDNVSNLQLFPGYGLPLLILQNIYHIIVYGQIILKTLLLNTI